MGNDHSVSQISCKIVMHVSSRGGFVEIKHMKSTFWLHLSVSLMETDKNTTIKCLLNDLGRYCDMIVLQRYFRLF